MEKFYKRSAGLAFTMLLAVTMAFAQTNISGTVKDGGNGETLAGVNIKIKGTVIGTISNTNGQFSLKANQSPPLTLEFSFIGFSTQEVEITDANTTNLEIIMQESTLLGQEIVVSASRFEESILSSPVSIEKMDILGVQNTASENYYKGLINMKGLDMSSSSINFQIINARGFNSTGNTRFVQLTDGMDTQAPALNFPVGNLNGPSELDVESVEFLPGASSALYGPNAFNGILLVNSKSPFEYQGLSAFTKLGLNHIGGEGDEPSSPQPMYEVSLRYAKAFNNKFAFKVNFSYSMAEDWYGTNYNDKNPERQGMYSFNPGADLVHQFGDEASANLGLLAFSPAFQANAQGAGLQDYVSLLPNDVISRSAYKEKDLVDYNAKNLKFGGSLHYRLTDKMEVLYSLNYGGGTSVYTGAQRYSLKKFSIVQHKVELKGSNFFIRAYTTQEDSGDSYIADLVGFRINNEWMTNTQWFGTYGIAYLTTVKAALDGQGLSASDFTNLPAATRLAIQQQAHINAFGFVETSRLAPNSEGFKDAANKYKKLSIADGGAKFDDNSALYHVQGQYDFTDKIKFADILIGATYRLFDLNSRGTIFADVPGNDITISEYGAYTQVTKRLGDLKLIGSIRFDKNENFDGQFSPRIAGVYTVANDHNFRVSYQTGFRNPTTQAQHIDLNVISAQLIGGLPQYAEKYQITYNTYTLASVIEYTDRVIAAGNSAAVVDPANIAVLKRFDQFRPVRPEEIKSIEVGYKGLMANQKLMLDLSFYFNEYTNFEYQTRVRRAVGDVSANAINASSLLTGDNTNTYQVYTNASGSVKSKGASVGLGYNLPKNFTITSNYSWNTLDKGAEDESGIYQFNTPEHKVNFTIANRKLTNNLGFAATWRWQQEFLWEGSFAIGTVPAFSTIDAQVSYKVPSIKSIFKVGGSNILNERYIMNYGSPTLGAIYYVSITFDQFLNK
jgi:iron complex outermembrane recepter protein